MLKFWFYDPNEWHLPDQAVKLCAAFLLNCKYTNEYFELDDDDMESSKHRSLLILLVFILN